MSIVITQNILPANTIYFDTFDQWSVSRPKTITAHPVIPSPEVSDHVQVKNIVVSFRGYIGTPAGVVPSATPAAARLFFDTIGGSLCTILAPFGVFTNMVIQADEMEELGNMMVNVRATQVRIATIAEVPIPPRTPNPAAAAQQASTQDVGSSAASSSGASLATSLVDGGTAVLDSLGSVVGL